MEQPVTLDTVLDGLRAQSEGKHRGEAAVDDLDLLRTVLYERENAIADFLRGAAPMFGLMPQIVAKVLMDSNLGTPVSEEERALVNQGFATLMDEIRRQNEQ